MMKRTLLLFFVSIVLTFSIAASADANHNFGILPQARPVLILVHGCCQGNNPGQVARQKWEENIEKGLERIGAKGLIRRSDIRFIWYANTLDPRKLLNNPTCTHHESIPHSIKLLKDRFTARLKKGVLLGLARLLSYSGTVENAALRYLPDVEVYFKDAERRCAVQEQVIDLFRDLGNENKHNLIVAAHSLGSLVMFDVLYDYTPQRASDRDLNVDEFITFGSMLSFPSVYQALLGKFIRPPFYMPPRLRKWTNVINIHDPIAFPIDDVLELRSNQVVNDIEIQQGATLTGHSIDSYFSSDKFIKSLVKAWNRSLIQIRNAP